MLRRVLREGVQVGDDVQITTWLHRARTVLHDLEHLAGYAVHPAQAVRDVQAAVALVEDVPPGASGSARALADRCRRAATTLADTSRQLTLARRERLPAALVGDAAGTADDALRALEHLAEWSARGTRTLQSALDQYADDLAAAQRRHRTGHDDVHDAADQLGHLVASVHVDLDVDLGPLHLDGPSLDVPDPVGTARNVGRVLTMATTGGRTCVGAYEDAQVAADRLERALTDAEGDAPLAGRSTPPGFTVLDTAVMAAQTRDDADLAGDPDHEQLDARQWALLQRRLAGLGPADRAAVQQLLAGAPDAGSRAALLQALAGGAPLTAVRYLDQRLASLPPDDRAALLAGDVGTTFSQQDETTCGSTSLLRLAAQSDPLLLLWLRTGQRAPGWTPPYLRGMPAADWRLTDPQQRLAAAQQSMHDTTSQHGWPEMFGTSPWDAAAVASDMRGTTGTSYEPVMVDDQDRTQLSGLLTRAADAANRGTPVPLYVGGDGTDGIPRHVVLVTGYHAGGYELFDPSSGQTTVVPEGELLDGGGDPLPALGGWTHPDWVVLPEAG